MATQILVDGARNAVVKVIGGGTITIANLVGSPTDVRINKVIYDIGATAASVAWKATVDEVALALSGYGTMCFKDFGGLQNNAGAGKNGNIVVTNGETDTIILYLVKE